jgi:transposase
MVSLRIVVKRTNSTLKPFSFSSITYSALRRHRLESIIQSITMPNCTKNGEKISLEFLPPYSPDLNPIENVWKLTRRLATHNRYSPTLSDIANAVEIVFAQWAPGSDSLRRLCAIN